MSLKSMVTVPAGSSPRPLWTPPAIVRLYPAAQIGQGGSGGRSTAHAVHAAARRGGRGAQVDALERGTVRVPPWHRARHGLPERPRPGVDVAADVVGVVGLITSRRTDGA